MDPPITYEVTTVAESSVSHELNNVNWIIIGGFIVLVLVVIAIIGISKIIKRGKK
jgi:hypothetical protein